MDIFGTIAQQAQAMGLPLFAVSLTALTRSNTPVLLQLHWHGFATAPDTSGRVGVRQARHPQGLPGSALQLSTRWFEMAEWDRQMLEAAWQFGAWDLLREEHRGCETAGAGEREEVACRRAFACAEEEDAAERWFVCEAPDRLAMLRLGARLGYVRWQFRPVKSGVWTGADDTLARDGGRLLPCPVPVRPQVGPRLCHTRYSLGRQQRIVLL